MTVARTTQKGTPPPAPTREVELGKDPVSGSGREPEHESRDLVVLLPWYTSSCGESLRSDSWRA